MPETTVHAIILRRRDAGESDRRLTVLSLEEGKIDVIAKGARKGGSRLAGISDPLSAAVLGLASGKRTRFVTQAQPLTSFRGLRSDYERLSFALALVELYAAVLPWEEPLPEAYELLIESLRHLEAHAKPLIALLWAETRLMDISGFTPQFESCVVTGTEIVDAEPVLSPMAGGFVSESSALAFVDRFRARAEAVYGLARLPALDAPPAHMKFAPEALAALFPFWRAIAEAPLPANEAVVREVRHPQ
jgi:DNA repair protein RecO (recombination protein O)